MSKYQRTIPTPSDHVAHVLYGLLCSGNRPEFTVQDVVGWLSGHNIWMGAEEVRRTLATLAEYGLLCVCMGSYEIAGMRSMTS